MAVRILHALMIWGTIMSERNRSVWPVDISALNG